MQWFDVGADLLGKGIILLPFVGVIAFARGALVIVLAMLYLLFAAGMLLKKNWAWWLGLIVCAINVLLVINVVIQGESVSRAVLWLIAPIIIAVYLVSRSGRASHAVNGNEFVDEKQRRKTRRREQRGKSEAGERIRMRLAASSVFRRLMSCAPESSYGKGQ